ncbi:MAG: hypothetical protein PVH88_11245 [Ignavibacteria bacterium]|jgi:hypothetical protein
MNGFAISLYDKFDELEILVDIIRYNWENKYFISVCSNHPDAQSKISHLEIDRFTQGEDIYFGKELSMSELSIFGRNSKNNHLWNTKGRIYLGARVYDTIKKSVEGLYDSNIEFGTHIHCDAWPLSEYKYVSLINNMRKNSMKFAFRGLGLSVHKKDTPLGHIDDHFFSFDINIMKENSFFDRSGLEMLPHKLSIHGMLAILMLTKIGLKKSFFFDDISKNYSWPGVKVIPFFRGNVNPSSLNEEYGFFHLHRQSFPGNLGKNLQVYFLKKYNLTKGEYIPKFINSYNLNERILFSKLNSELDNLKKRLRKYFTVTDIMGNDLVFMRKVLEKSNKFDLISKNILFNFWLFLKKIYSKSSLEKAIQYDDSMWPKSLKQYYHDNVDTNLFSPEHIWFEDTK